MAQPLPTHPMAVAIGTTPDGGGMAVRIKIGRMPTMQFLASEPVPLGRIWSQIIQPACYERAHKESDHEFIIISLGEHGLALVRDTEKIDDGKKDVAEVRPKIAQAGLNENCCVVSNH